MILTIIQVQFLGGYLGLCFHHLSPLLLCAAARRILLSDTVFRVKLMGQVFGQTVDSQHDYKQDHGHAEGFIIFCFLHEQVQLDGQGPS